MCILIEIVLKLYTAFGSIAILTILILPIQKHVISYHFLELEPRVEQGFAPVWWHHGTAMNGIDYKLLEWKP